MISMTTDHKTATFYDAFSTLDWDALKQLIADCGRSDVTNALARKRQLSLKDFAALISPAAEPYLETMAQKSAQLTRKRFGRTLQLFAPLYLSNKCQNICTYCGFSMNNPIRRITLTESELHSEAQALRDMGFKHILLVTGEAPRTVGVEYFKQALSIMEQYFDHLSIETQPLEMHEYAELKKYGLDAVLVYQETYNRVAYAKYHLRGNKQNFIHRLETPDRLAQAGIYKIGLGALIGLEDWRTDALITAHHLRYMQQYYWRSRYSISFPRLRPCEGEQQPVSEITDRQLVQLICAWRLLSPEIELSLSTREEPFLRDHIFPLGITIVSAASSTQPGGYSQQNNVNKKERLQQFETADQRCVTDIAAAIKRAGLETVWHDRELRDLLSHSNNSSSSQLSDNNLITKS